MTESRFVKSRRNIIESLLQHALNLLLVWAGRIVFVRVLSADYLGINGLFTDIISILSVADLGIPAAMTYSLYKPLAEGDERKTSSMVEFFKRVYLVIAGAVFVIGLCLIPVLPRIVNLEDPIPNLNIYYVLMLINTVVTYLFVYRTTLFTADQKSYILQRYTMVFLLIAFLVKVAVLYSTKDYIFYLSAGIVTGIVSNVVQNLAAYKHYPFLKAKPVPLEVEEKKTIWRNVFDLFVYRISGVVMNNTDSILISIYAGTILVGYYSNYQMMILAVTTVITVIFTNIKASLGSFNASSDSTEEKKLDVFWTLDNMNFWLTSFCSISFLCLFRDFIKLSFGSEYVLPTSLTVIIVLNFYTSNIRQSIGSFRETTGVFHEMRYIMAVTSMINIVLSVVLGYFYGVSGVLISTLISRLVYSWWKEPIILFRRCFNCSSRRYYINYLLQFVIFGIVGAVSFLMCEAVRIPNEYIAFVLKAVICLVVPNGIIYCILSRNNDVRDLLQRLFKRL